VSDAFLELNLHELVLSFFTIIFRFRLQSVFFSSGSFLIILFKCFYFPVSTSFCVLRDGGLNYVARSSLFFKTSITATRSAIISPLRLAYLTTPIARLFHFSVFILDKVSFYFPLPPSLRQPQSRGLYLFLILFLRLFLIDLQRTKIPKGLIHIWRWTVWKCLQSDSLPISYPRGTAS
jgi:hypothetical protein